MTRWGAVGRWVAILSGIAATRLPAQAPDTATVDRIVAVVGNKAIVQSQVQEELLTRAQRDPAPDPVKEPAAYARTFRRYVDTLVAFELLLREAQADTTIKVTDQEVQEAADQLINNARRQFKTTQDFVTELKGIGFNSIEEWRTALIEKQRRSFAVNRFRSQLQESNKIKPMTPTDKEMRAYYAAHLKELDSFPAAISLKQIVVAPKPSDSARVRARALADSLVTELRKGADFAVTARRFSMDETTRDDGGNLKWFRRGVMAREFEDAAFGLKVGQVSDPVESPFGFHIIQVQRANPGEIQAAHILIIPDADSAAARAAHDKAVEIAAALKSGASFDSVQHLYHDRAEEMELTDYPVDSLAATPYAPALATVDSGKVSDPFELPVKGFPLRSKWAVVKVVRRIPPGPRSYDDVKDALRRGLGIALGQENYIKQLRERTYVDIRVP